MGKKFHCILLFIGLSMTLFLVKGCGKASQKVEDNSLKNIVNLSSSDISSIKASEGDGAHTEFKDLEQVKEISSTLSKLILEKEYKFEEDKDDVVEGGRVGIYFLITYSSGESSHIQIDTENNKLEIRGYMKKEKIDNGWRVYKTIDSSKTTDIKKILSMKPTSK